MVVTGRPRKFDREVALDAAMRVFWRKGFAAASMNDLCEAMDIRSPSLYGTFGGKEALYAEAIDHYVAIAGPLLWDRLDEGGSARNSVERFLLAAAEILPESEEAPSGCMAVMGGVGDEWPTQVADLVAAVRGKMLDRFRARLRAAVAGGELTASTEVEPLARLFFAVLQGMATQARDGATPADLRKVAEAAMGLWPKG